MKDTKMIIQINWLLIESNRSLLIAISCFWPNHWEREKCLCIKSIQWNYTPNCFRSNILEWIITQLDTLNIWNICIWSKINIQKYFPIWLSEDYRNSTLQNWWMLDLEDLHSFISNHFINTSHCQWTWIIILSTECIVTECNGL